MDQDKIEKKLDKDLEEGHVLAIPLAVSASPLTQVQAKAIPTEK